MATITVPRGTSDLSGLGTADHDILQFMNGECVVTAGLDLSGFTDGLAALIFGANASVYIDASNPLKLDVDYGASPVVHYAQNSGSVALHPGGGSGAFTRVRHVGAAPLILMGGGTVTTHEQARGSGTVTGAVSLTNEVLTGGELLVRYKSTAVTKWEQSGGRGMLMRSQTAIWMYGGVLDVYPENAGTNVPTATTIYHFGGTINWRGGNIGTLIGRGATAVLNMSEITQDVAVATVDVDTLYKRNARSKFNGSKYAVTYGGSALSVRADDNDAFPA